MFDLHRHDEYSTFDGFGKAGELAKLAKDLGYTALSTTNHGNTNGLVRTYHACKEYGLKAILGVEGYFIPKYKPQHRGYHLVLIAKNLVGYGNINRIQYEGEQQKYYNPIWTFELLEKYSEGVICTTACVAGFLGQMIKKGKIDVARKFLKRMVKIFGDDFYIEVQPYVISEPGLQERVNVKSIALARELGIKCVLTSDSHYGNHDDFDTYMKMHEIANHNLDDIEATYGERYMPEMGDMADRFHAMHKDDYGGKKAAQMAFRMYEHLEEIEAKCEENYLDDLPLELPMFGEGSYDVLRQKVKLGMQKRGKWTKEYIARCKEELEIIEFHGFSDYFLIVADYVNWAKDEGIIVGPGRGSVCNSLIAYALHITDVDSLLFELDFRRFLRKDKKKLPDIDLDFETSRRQEVVDYICRKYEGHAARICSYGLYKVDNLINDLAKVCGLPLEGDGADYAEWRRGYIKMLKEKAAMYVTDDGTIDEDYLRSDEEVQTINEMYDNIFIHFLKLFNKVRFIGTHAAGVAITGGSLLDYVALRVDKAKNEFTSYNLMDAEMINVVKFDILGLKTMESIGELRRVTGDTCNYDEIVNDPEIIKYFFEGNCDGVFQFERGTPRKIMEQINADCFDDIAATTAMNRPGPLQMGMPEVYAQGKFDSKQARKAVHWEYTKETYGTIVYQEQLQQICLNIGMMEWADADKMMKMLRGHEMTEAALKIYNKEKRRLTKAFVAGATQNGLTKAEATDLFSKMIVYSFNKGHAVGYTLISFEEMYYKVYYPNEYWFVKMKHARDDAEYARFCAKAVNDGSLIFLPHINYSKSLDSLRKFEDTRVIQQGLSTIKGVGEKAALAIEYMRRQDGPFLDVPDFEERRGLLPKEMKRTITSATVTKLREAGAFEFDDDNYLKRVVKYCSAMKGRNFSQK